MRQRHPTTASAAVSAALCHWVVCQLALADYKQSVPAVMLARLLLLACATRQSLSFLAQRCEEAPSDETVRKALLAYLPGADLLLRPPGRVPARCPCRAAPAATATRRHRLPLPTLLRRPGHPRRPRRQAEAGTNYFWTFATLALLTPGQRYTLGLVAVPTGQPPAETVALLLEQAQRSGVRLRYLLLDKGFYDAETIALLQGQGVRFVVPLVRRGDQEKHSGTTRFFRRDCWHGLVHARLDGGAQAPGRADGEGAAAAEGRGACVGVRDEPGRSGATGCSRRGG